MTFSVTKFKGLLLASTLSMLIEFLMGLSDSIVVGNLIGEEALAGVNLLQTPMNLVSFFACMLGTGTAICFALEVGRFDRKRASEMFSQGFWGALLVGLLLMLCLVVVREPFLTALGAHGMVRDLAVSYWKWYVPCAFLEPLAVLLASSAYADGDGRICMYAYSVQLLGNVGLSILLVLMMGMSGCALGTVLGNLGAVCVLLFHFARKSNTLRLVRYFSFRDLFRLCASSFGDAATRLCWAVLFFLFNKYVIDRFGTGMLPVASVVIALLGISEAFNGVPNAAQPLVGVYLGERNYKGVRTVMAAASRIIVAEGFCLSLLLVIFPKMAVDLVGIVDPVLVKTACGAVRIVSLGFTFWAIASLFNSYYLFIEHEALACTYTAVANFIAPWCLYMLLGSLWGAVGVWVALALAPLVAVVAIGAYVYLRYGRETFPLLLPHDRDAREHVFDLALNPPAICGVSAAIGRVVRDAGFSAQIASRVALLVEEVFMAVRDRNKDKAVIAEAALDLNDNAVSLILRDDGEIFDITDADQQISSLRTYLVASLMERQSNRRNLTTTGFNRNVFKFS